MTTATRVRPGRAPRTNRPDRLVGPSDLGVSPQAPHASSGNPIDMVYRLRREDRHNWAICKRKERDGVETWEAFNWYPKLEQACDRLTELCLGNGIEGQLFEIRELRQHVEDLKHTMTKQMTDRLMLK